MQAENSACEGGNGSPALVSHEQLSCVRECHDRCAEIHVDLRSTSAGSGGSGRSLKVSLTDTGQLFMCVRRGGLVSARLPAGLQAGAEYRGCAGSRLAGALMSFLKGRLLAVLYV